MNLDDLLHSVSLLDCTGRVSHTLTLLIDGSVRVRVGGLEAIVDPVSRSTRPPMVRLGRGEHSHEQIIDLACNLAREM